MNNTERLTRETPHVCGHVDPSGIDRACECTACARCEWPTDDLFVQADGELVCGDCIDGEEE